MAIYILRRVLISIPVLFGITVAVFVFINLLPGNPASYFINPSALVNPDALQIEEQRLGLNQPLPVRYLKWLDEMLHGNLGYRTVTGEPVAASIWAHLKATALLVGLALLFGSTAGIILGVYTSLHQYSLADYALTAMSFLGIAMPAFIAGILGLYLFALKIPIFPAGGMSTVGRPPSPLNTLYHAILPAILLSVAYMATFMRYTRFSMLEILRQDYMQTARAKGLSERRVVYAHALRNALLPVVTVLGLSLPNLVVGAVFIESIFSWPGMGPLYLDAIQSRDYPLVLGMNLVTAIVILTVNLITDIAYAFIDPRIRYS